MQIRTAFAALVSAQQLGGRSSVWLDLERVLGTYGVWIGIGGEWGKSLGGKKPASD